jgi:hypothetical protein
MNQCEKLFLPIAKPFEYDVPWLYLDNASAATMTGGIGCVISLEQAKSLPFTIGDLPASVAQIVTNYQRVAAMAPGKKYTYYEYTGCLILEPNARETLFYSRTGPMVQHLVHVFVDFLSWPMPAQLPTLNMIFELGPEKFDDYLHWKLAAAQKDWVHASKECGIDVELRAFDDRNRWMTAQFVAASQEQTSVMGVVGNPTTPFTSSSPN